MHSGLLHLTVATLDRRQFAKQQGTVRRGRQGLLVLAPGLVQPARGCGRPRLRHGIVDGAEPQCLDARGEVERRIGRLCRLEARDRVRRPVQLRLRKTAADQRRRQRRLQGDGLVEARDRVVEVVLRQRDVAEPRGGRCTGG